MLARKAINALRIKFALAKLAKEKSKTLEKLKKSKLKLKIDHDSKNLSTSKCKKVVEYIKNTPVFQEGAYPNEIRQNFTWFLLGSTLNIFFYFVLVYQLKTSATFSCLICLSFGSIFSIGMPYSTTIRCIIFLALPGFCTSKGRTFLIMYAFILTLNEPMMNFNHNIMIMTKAMTCGQEVANNQTEKLLSTALDPLSNILDGIENFVSKVNHYSRMTQQAFLSMKRGMEELVASINRLFSWLSNMVNVCNDKMLEPYQKCIASFKAANQECREIVATAFVGFCNLVDIFTNICHLARIIEMICSVTAVINGFLQETFAVPVLNAVQNLHDMFYFKVIVSHVYQASIEQTKSYTQVRDDVLRQVREKLSAFFMKMQLFGIPAGFAICFVFLKAVHYRLKYLSQNNFDNIYLSKMFYEIDKDRMLEGKETLLPLKKSEKKKYIDLITLRLSSREKKKFFTGFVFLLISFCTIGFYLFCDYGLYWILDLVRRSFSIKVDKESIPRLKLHVRGKGPYADMFRSMVSLFEPLEDDEAFEKSTLCLPKPNEPNFVVYHMIGAIFSVCLLSVILEAYCLRLRQVVCGYFYTHRAKERTYWQYFNLLLRRGSFLKFMRRTTRRNYRSFFDKKKISWTTRMASRFPMFQRILKALGMDTKFCIGCTIEGDIDDRSNFEHCENEGCGAVYCLDCYYDLHNICTVCMKPVDYGDLSDVDEERNSSDDDESYLAVENREKRTSSKLKQPKEKNKNEEEVFSRRNSELIMQKVFDTLGIVQTFTNYDPETN